MMMDAGGWCWRVFVGGVGSSPACLGPHLPCLLLCPQVLDGLLAQYGTVENVEQGKMVQRGPHPCKIPSAALPRPQEAHWDEAWLDNQTSSTGLKWVLDTNPAGGGGDTCPVVG